jgi:molybdopterin molybdotransferase
MDGFAARLSDLRRIPLPIVDEALAGQPAKILPPSAVIRINTGAAVPGGTDAVIKRENAIEDETGFRLCVPVESIRAGENIRRQGENAATGAIVSSGGVVMTPPMMAALATFGTNQVKVHRRVRVGLLITGDEISPHDEPQKPWRIRDSNGPSLGALLEPITYLSVGECLAVPDDPTRIRSVLDKLIRACDAVFITGGVSMGTCDHVPDVLRELDAEIVFHRLPIRPGKPILAAIGAGGQPILALPGNPVSVMVTANRFGLAMLAKKAGIVKPIDSVPFVRLEGGSAQPSDLWCDRLVQLCKDGVAELIPNRGSGDIVAAARSDGFIEIPPGKSGDGPWPFYSWSH